LVSNERRKNAPKDQEKCRGTKTKAKYTVGLFKLGGDQVDCLKKKKVHKRKKMNVLCGLKHNRKRPKKKQD